MRNKTVQENIRTPIFFNRLISLALTLAVRYGFSTRKTHVWHTLTTSGITLADGQRVSMVVPSCLLPVSPGVAQAGNERVFSVVVDMNSLRTYPQLPGILLSECARLQLAVTNGAKVGLPQLGWNLSGQRTHHSSPQ
ncbi:hypothetical protein DDQ45_25315 [Salmonella enterica]|nr:hypothetical protein [Salmonella enterica]EDR7525427.1 hypothetical protein [Salmonella enterica subsp. enterica serovar Oranienburg]EIM5533549.1 hypothetical protein [Salmonella enterica subsp. enterica]